MLKNIKFADGDDITGEILKYGRGLLVNVQLVQYVYEDGLTIFVSTPLYKQITNAKPIWRLVC